MTGGLLAGRRRRLACAAIWLSSAVGLAGINEWTPIGPPGGLIGVFAVDPRNPARLYAGTFDPTLTGKTVGVFRSADRGQTWQFTSVGTLGITGLAVDPGDSSILYASSFWAGLFRSEDFGTTWTQTIPGGYEQAKSLAMDPSNPGTLYVAVGHLPLVFTGDSICRTSDGGRSWDRCFGFGNGVKVTRIIVDPVVPAQVYASIDARLWTSTDAGLHWIQLTSLPPGGYGNVAITATLPPIVYTDGLFQSADAGMSWAFLGAPPLGPGFILPDPSAAQTIYVAGQGGVSRTVDGGASWISLTRGFPSASAALLAFDPLDGDTLYATGAGSLYRLTVADRGSPCSPDAETLCLGDGRFRVTVSWTTATGEGSGKVVPLTQDAGAFWFFSQNNLELAIKVVDGRFLNGRFWVFGAGLTDVAYDLGVTDMKTGVTWTHRAEPGRLESFADTDAF